VRAVLVMGGFKMVKRLGVVALCLWGCQQAPGEPSVELVAADLSSPVTRRPIGMMCGLSYKNLWERWVDGICAFSRTLGPEPPEPGYQVYIAGDTGLAPNDGFRHQAWAGDPSQDSSQLYLPKGTDCGMKNGCWDHTATCMGMDPSQQCPYGWEKRSAADYKAPAGCVFEWCEYQDPGNLCPGGNCPVPNGLTCGLTDNEGFANPNHIGRCLGKQTWAEGCPAGFVRRGFYDNGRSAGKGVGWCEKL
jgi:hypothetical protein